MIRARSLLVLLCVSRAAPAQRPAPVSAAEVTYRKPILRDTAFAVYLLEIPSKRASVMHRHEADMLTVFVSGGETVNTIRDRQPVRESIAAGDVRFRRAGFTHATENIGRVSFRAVIVEFASPAGDVQASKHPDAHYCTGASETACVDEQGVLCTARFCVRRVTIGPGAVWQDSDTASRQLLIGVTGFALAPAAGPRAAALRRRSGEIEYGRGVAGGRWMNVAKRPAVIVDVVFDSAAGLRPTEPHSAPAVGRIELAARPNAPLQLARPRTAPDDAHRSSPPASQASIATSHLTTRWS